MIYASHQRNPTSTTALVATLLGLAAVGGVAYAASTASAKKAPGKPSVPCPTDAQGQRELADRLAADMKRWADKNPLGPPPAFPKPVDDMTDADWDAYLPLSKAYTAKAKAWSITARDQMVKMAGRCGRERTSAGQRVRAMAMCSFFFQQAQQHEYLSGDDPSEIVNWCEDHPTWDPLDVMPWDVPEPEIPSEEQ